MKMMTGNQMTDIRFSHRRAQCKEENNQKSSFAVQRFFGFFQPDGQKYQSAGEQNFNEPALPAHIHVKAADQRKKQYSGCNQQDI